MLIASELLKSAVPELMEADKALTQVSYRDLVTTAQTNTFFLLGMRDKEMMQAGFAAYRKAMQAFENEVFDIYSRFRAGTYNKLQAVNAFKEVCGRRYTEMFAAGTQAIGVDPGKTGVKIGFGANPYYRDIGLTRKDKAFLNHMRREELRYWRNFLNDIDDPNHIPRHPYDKRAMYYAKSGRSAFMNGMVAGAGTELEVHWILGGGKPCHDCIDLASRKWTWKELPTTPRAGGTRCLMNCHCHLEFREPSKAVHVETPGSGTVEALMAAGRYARVLGRKGEDITGPLRTELEAMYARMYKARQMMELSDDTMYWMRQRKALNKMIIDRMEAGGFTVKPTVSVKDLVAMAKKAADEGYDLVRKV